MTAPLLIERARRMEERCAVTAPATADLLSDLADYIAAQSRTIQLQGNEIASLTLQLEAAGLAKPAQGFGNDR